MERRSQNAVGGVKGREGVMSQSSGKGSTAPTVNGRSHSELEYKDLLGEFQALQRKLERKTEALLLVSQDLGKCQQDRDAYREKTEHLHGKCLKSEGSLKRQEKELDSKEFHHNEEKENMLALLTGLRKENRILQDENILQRQQLKETKGDLRVLRQQLAKLQLGPAFEQLTKPGFRSSCGSDSSLKGKQSNSLEQECSSSQDDTVFNDLDSPKKSMPSLDFSEFGLEEVERLRQQYVQLEGDLRSVLCEKEELVCEKDTYKKKCERLSQELNLILSGNEDRVVGDLDSILAENRYLKAQLENAQEETGLAKAALNKYRHIMERRKNKASSHPPSGSHHQDLSRQHSGSSDRRHLDKQKLMTVVTPKQVEELLGERGVPGGSTDYRSLATALFDAVSDKNLALSHLRKTNKILGKRVTELEAKLRAFEESKSPIRLSPNSSCVLLGVGQHPPEPIHSISRDPIPLPSGGETTPGSFTDIDLSSESLSVSKRIP